TAADAAALAGAVKLTGGGGMDAAREEVRAVLDQNGVDTEAVRFDVQTQSGGRLRVTVDDPDVFMSFGRLFRSTMTIERSATAVVGGCGDTCPPVRVELAPPLGAISAAARGDGFQPIIVGARIFAINHHQGATNESLVCVDRRTNATCPGYPKVLSSMPGGTVGDISTNYKPTADVVGERIYYAAQRPADVGVACFDTVTATSCGYVRLANLTRGSNSYGTRAGGPVAVGGKLYAFTDDTRVHCIDPATMTFCSGYPKSSGATLAGYPPLDLADQRGDSRPIEPIALGTRIYSPLHYVEGTQRHYGSVLHCFDTSAAAPCAGFAGGVGAAYLLTYDTGEFNGAGAVFLRYDRDLVPDGVCLSRQEEHNCVTLDGGPLGPVPGLSQYINGSVDRMMRPATLDGRTFFPDRSGIATCWDWRTAGFCGQRTTSGTADYAYASDGSCIVGTGHSMKVFSFRPDFAATSSGACGASGATLTLPDCLCSGGGVLRPTVTLSGADPRPGIEFTSFVVQARLPDGTVLGSYDLLNGIGVVDVRGVPADASDLTIAVQAEVAPGVDPWADATKPTVTVSYRSVPALVS
ncbi:MAG: hypothetical protein OEY23_25200, partial [Acidimicrobiia bacterium]|nr:hypothetical protein [Acidimicrobiia bacterium]